MTLKEGYLDFLKQLKTVYNDEEAAVIAGWIFESAADAKRSDILSGSSTELYPAVIKNLDEKLSQLLRHRPVQYVLGETWFYKLKLKVNEHVLIPRPETEELVELILHTVRNNSWQLTVDRPQLSLLDIGTGSGCIAIAIKKSLPNILITAIDVSEGALNVAKENAAAQSAEIEFKQIDFLDESNFAALQKFDLIVSNPPYIPFNEKETLDKNVTAWEPHTALFVPENDPLLFYKKIAFFGKTHLNEGGRIFVELHENYAQESAAVFSKYYKNIELKKDLFQKERMLTAYS